MKKSLCILLMVVILLGSFGCNTKRPILETVSYPSDTPNETPINYEETPTTTPYYEWTPEPTPTPLDLSTWNFNNMMGYTKLVQIKAYHDGSVTKIVDPDSKHKNMQYYGYSYHETSIDLDLNTSGKAIFYDALSGLAVTAVSIDIISDTLITAKTHYLGSFNAIQITDVVRLSNNAIIIKTVIDDNTAWFIPYDMIDWSIDRKKCDHDQNTSESLRKYCEQYKYELYDYKMK